VSDDEKPPAKVLRLVPESGSSKTQGAGAKEAMVEALEELLEDVESGHIVSLAFAAGIQGGRKRTGIIADPGTAMALLGTVALLQVRFSNMINETSVEPRDV